MVLSAPVGLENDEVADGCPVDDGNVRGATGSVDVERSIRLTDDMVVIVGASEIWRADLTVECSGRGVSVVSSSLVTTVVVTGGAKLGTTAILSMGCAVRSTSGMS
jgi:hypothetical protein